MVLNTHVRAKTSLLRISSIYRAGRALKSIEWITVLRLRQHLGRLISFGLPLWIMQGAQGNWSPNLGTSLGCLELAT